MLVKVVVLVGILALAMTFAPHAQAAQRGCSMVWNPILARFVLQCQDGDGGVVEGPPGIGGGGDGGPAGLGYPTSGGRVCATPPTAPTAPPADLGLVEGVQGPTSVAMFCAGDINGNDPFFFWATPAEPPVDRLALSRLARASIAIPTFTLQFGPDPSRLAVNVPVEFEAVAQGATVLSGTASDRGVTVTVSGHLLGLSWRPGEPENCTAGDRKALCSGTKAPVECGVAMCLYTYQWVSSKERTGGDPAWPVAAVASWEFTFTSSGTGAATGPASDTWTESIPAGNAAISVGEWRTAGGFSEGG